MCLLKEKIVKRIMDFVERILASVRYLMWSSGRRCPTCGRLCTKHQFEKFETSVEERIGCKKCRKVFLQVRFPVVLMLTDWMIDEKYSSYKEFAQRKQDSKSTTL